MKVTYLRDQSRFKVKVTSLCNIHKDVSIGGKRVRFYSDVFIETFCLYFHFATTSFKYTQNLQILHHHCARARFERPGAEETSDQRKLHPLGSLVNASSRAVPSFSSRGYFPLDASRSRLFLDFCALSSSSSLDRPSERASKYARAPSCERTRERDGG